MITTVKQGNTYAPVNDCSFFASYSPEEIQGNLWQLYRGWAHHLSHCPDGKVMVDMLQFYERLSAVILHRQEDTEQNVIEAPEISIAPPKKDRYKAKDLQSVLDFIVETIPVEKIFMLEHRFEDNSAKNIIDLLVVLSPTSRTPFADLEPLVEFAALGHPHVSVSLHTSGQLEHMLKNGHIYYSVVCRAENLVYDDHSRYLPPLPVDRFHEIREAARRDFYLNHTRGTSYHDSARENYALGRRDTALFLAHQAMELCFRGILWALLSQDKRTHSIKVLKKFTRRIAPQLAAIFSDETQKDERFLQFLEDSYLDARYKHDLVIDENVLLMVLAKAGKVVEVSKKVFDDWIAGFEVPVREMNSNRLIEP